MIAATAVLLVLLIAAIAVARNDRLRSTWAFYRSLSDGRCVVHNADKVKVTLEPRQRASFRNCGDITIITKGAYLTPADDS